MSVREIGSDFHFPLRSLIGSRRSSEILPLEGSNTVSVASGRDALYWIIYSLGLPRGSQVLLPAYLCDAVVKPFLDNGLRVHFYGITSDLQVDSADLASKLSSEIRILLYIPYFGFPLELPQDVIKSANPQTIVVEDSTHAFLSSPDQLPAHADIRFASLTKMLPVPNGAVTSWADHLSLDLTPPGMRLSLGYLGALSSRCLGGVLKALWLRFPWLFPKRMFRLLFFWSAALLDSYPKPASMASISKHIFESIDLREVVTSRRRNFQYLLAWLEDTNHIRIMYRSLPEGICPLGFPILTENRDGLRRHLISHRVYPPIHWEFPEIISREEFHEAWSISNHILTIPIDQRYSEEDMARIVDLINRFCGLRSGTAKGREVQWPAGR